MSEPSKMVDGGVTFLRTFPPALRILVFILLLFPLALILNGRYNWPHWPVHGSLWLNIIGFAFLAIAFAVLLWYTPHPAMSVAELPEKKPILEPSLKYFKTGPELKGPRRQLLKIMQNAYVQGIVPNEYELSAEEMQACSQSEWEFDRIASYLFERYKQPLTQDQRINRVGHEVRLLNAGNWTGSLVPLHYAVESVHAVSSQNNSQIDKPQREIFEEILNRLDSWTARLSRVYKDGKRGEKIVKHCREILEARSAAATISTKHNVRGHP
jgi:exonuclease VII small subunit